MSKNFTLANDSECDFHALYDENRKLVVAWQEGDDISRVLKTLIAHNGDTLTNRTFSIDGDVPKTI